MVSNYLKIAVRHLFKHPTYSLLNIAGLSIGLVTTILILLWINDEHSYNRFHTHYDQIYSVWENQLYPDGNVATYASVPTPLAAALKEALPEVSYAARVSWGETRLFSYKEKTILESGLHVDPDFLHIFSFPLIIGDKTTALTEPNTVLITQKLAKKYFGNENPLNKFIRINQETNFKIVGVLRDIPRHSTMQFDFLMPMQNYLPKEEYWDNDNILTYVRLQEGSNFSQVHSKIDRMINKYRDNLDLFLHACADWHLRTDFKNGQYTGGGRITYVRLFGLVAVFVLVIACINFINLSTARATQRAKEVGVRKVIGANRQALIRQFMGEAMLLTGLAGILALLITSIALPFFNRLLDKQLTIEVNNSSYVSGFIGILLLTGMLAGLYPAFVLSAFHPIKALKSFQNRIFSRNVRLRQSLVVAQFAISAILITGTIVVYQQPEYIRHKNLGYQKENLVWFDVENLTSKQYEVAQTEFSKIPGVQSITVTNTEFKGPSNRETGVNWPGKTPHEETQFAFINADHQFLPTLGLQLTAGRNFSSAFGMDTTNFIINEEAARRMKLTNPVGQPLTYGNQQGTIIGVVKDFHLSSIHTLIEPTIIIYRPRQTWIMFTRINGQNIPATLRKLESVYKSLLPGYPFNFHFANQEYDSMYHSEMQIAQLANIFSALAIFISCLGLFGLSAFTVERRTKEIGIRKVLGASIPDIFMLISKEFLILVLIALFIATFPAWHFMNNWLDTFAYRIPVDGWVFIWTGIVALLIALMTVGFQSIKAALMNPVKSLRNE